jgi:Tol biopolymer transport system component
VGDRSQLRIKAAKLSFSSVPFEVGRIRPGKRTLVRNAAELVAWRRLTCLVLPLVAATLVVGAALTAGAGSSRAAPRSWVAKGLIVLSSDRDGDGDVYAVSAAGGRAKALTHNFDPDGVVASGRTVAREWRGSVYVLRRTGWSRLTAGGLLGVYDNGRRIAVQRSTSVVVVSADGRRSWRLRAPGEEPYMAPDARHVAFRSVGPERTRYVVVAVETGKRREFAVRGWSTPRWSPDGKRVLLSDAVLLDVQNSAFHVRRLRSKMRFADWSPDGHWIAFTSEEGGTVAVVDAWTGTSWRNVSENASGYLLQWSPDGSRLAYVVARENGREVVVADVRARTSRLVDLAQPLERVAWSPDGQRLAYVLRETYSYDEDSSVSVRTAPALGAVRRDGTANRVLIRSDRVQFLAWSRDSASILFTRPGAVGAVALDGRVRGRSPMSLRSADNVVWSPSGDAVAFTGGYGGKSIYVVGATGTGLRRLTRTGHDAILAWVPAGAVHTRRLAVEPPSSESAHARALNTRGRIVDIAAEESRVAVLVAPSDYDCTHPVVWRPSRPVVRIGTAAPCAEEDSPPSPLSIDFKEGIVTWREYSCGNYCYISSASAPAAATDDVGGSGGDDGQEGIPLPPPSPPTTRGGATATVVRGVVRVERLADGRTTTIAVPGERIFAADLQEEGLFYAFNHRAGGFVGRVFFVPFAELFEGTS